MFQYLFIFFFFLVPNNNLISIPDNFSSMLNINTQNPPYCVSPMHSPNPMGLSPHWGHTHIIPSMCPYPHLNHLLPTQHMLHNNVIGAPRGLHGLSNPVMSGSFHPNGVSPNFSGIHGLNANSLTDSKESSGEYQMITRFIFANFISFS
jgi:hypothetical protein